LSRSSRCFDKTNGEALALFFDEGSGEFHGL
jgi:hypothetical protein